MSVDVVPSPAAPAPSSVTRSKRLEIEGLRTVAALLVAAYHIWFNKVSGGVDVFFVVTGFLITLTLAGHVRRNGRIAPLKYLGRLARRVWPAAALVLLSVLAMTIVMAPDVLRPRNFAETLASSLYLENWYLAASAVDYLNSEDPHTPVQHFWAMSLQGQFYVIWLFVALVAAAIAARRGPRFARVFAIAIAAIAIASFLWSLWYTSVAQPSAYFNTFTRLWEFGVGGLLALSGARFILKGRSAAIASWVGLLGLILCGIVLPASGIFPGYAALWPVLCAALLLVSSREAEVGWSATRLLAARPLSWLGGMAFGIYLWHWPLLIGYRYVRGEEAQPGWLAGTTMIVTAITLAIATHYLVERPVARIWAERPRARSGIASALVGAWLTVVVCSAIGIAHVQQLVDSASVEAEQVAVTAGDCFGAGELVTPEQCDARLDELPLVPERTALLADTGGAYSCYTAADADRLAFCRFGDGKTKVALIGNSHAAMYAPGLSDRAEKLDWTLDVMVGNGCVWSLQRADDPSLSERCASRLAETEEHLFGEGYDLVLFAGGRGAEEATDEQVDAIALNWDTLRRTGAQIAVIEDNPRIGDAGAGCVIATSEEDLRSGACDLSADVALSIRDRYVAAAESSGIPIVGTRDLYCSDTMCPAEIGSVIVYRDQHHATATYLATTLDDVVARLQTALATG
ncbi:acyltransferase family protein [Agromyces sp. NPDC058104]|uniref:acyltransferase family protein n=1 Tax=Agromyces sp. NPDC058104 TaxID=3346342 RepID=UPI0036DA33CF